MLRVVRPVCRVKALYHKNPLRMPRAVQHAQFASKKEDMTLKDKTMAPSAKTVPSQATAVLKSSIKAAIDVIMNPKDTWKAIKEVINHYWLGSKLLWSDIKITKQILGRLALGHGMTRRERIQLIRTTTDIFRLVPFSIFIIIPFMEFLLPFALRIFPNMLPSTFQDSLKQEETMKKELQMRLAVAQFMQESLQQMASKKNSSATTDDAKEVVDFMEKARLGQSVPNETVIRISRLFKDELTLANISRPQLVSMCRYMGLQPFGADAFLRFLLRNKLRLIQEDDRRILWEGVESLTTKELREACRERGMRSIGYTQFKLRHQLQEWLELSTLKSIPITLLIMSRALMLTDGSEEPEDVLKSSLSSFDADTINEVVLAAASEGEEDSADMRQRKLESLQFQQELIDDERKNAAHAHALVSSGDASAATPDHSSLDTAAAIAIPATVTNPVESKPADRQLSLPLVSEPTTDTTEIRATSNATEATADAKGTDELSIFELVALSDLARGSTVQREISELAILEAYLESLQQQDPDAELDVDSDGDTDVDAEAFADSDEIATPSSLTNMETLANGSKADSNVSTDVSISTIAPTSITAAATTTTTTSTGEENVGETVGSAGSGTLDDDIADFAAHQHQKHESKSVARMRSAITDMVNKLKIKIDTTDKVLGDRLKLLDQDYDGQISVDEIKHVIAKVLKRGDVAQQNFEQLFNLLDSNNDGKVSVVELLHYVHRRRENLDIHALEAQMRTLPDSNADTSRQCTSTALASRSKPDSTALITTNANSTTIASSVSREKKQPHHH